MDKNTMNDFKTLKKERMKSSPIDLEITQKRATISEKDKDRAILDMFEAFGQLARALDLASFRIRFTALLKDSKCKNYMSQMIDGFIEDLEELSDYVNKSEGE